MNTIFLPSVFLYKTSICSLGMNPAENMPCNQMVDTHTRRFYIIFLELLLNFPTKENQLHEIPKQKLTKRHRCNHRRGRTNSLNFFLTAYFPEIVINPAKQLQSKGVRGEVLPLTLLRPTDRELAKHVFRPNSARRRVPSVSCNAPKSMETQYFSTWKEWAQVMQGIRQAHTRFSLVFITFLLDSILFFIRALGEMRFPKE